ncbi:MAG TPA: FkbM family methyltransferase [Longimicrobium sp.]|jgi:FkbM family methyltransferase|nr:FkbM family methyltransferase [Longimicrobium sp.]
MPRLRDLLIRTGLYPRTRAVRRLFLSRRDRAREEEALAFYRAAVPPGALVFDLGANVGDVAEPLARVGARVVAVEPQPECLAELRARCGAYPGFVALPAVVGRAAGVATLYLRAHHASSSLRRDWFRDAVGTLDVPMVTLADLIARYGVPAYCKVDVEGSEEEVFATLPHPLPLVSFEYVDFALERAAACMRMLAPNGGAEANIALTSPLRFALPEWLPPDELLRRLPGLMAEGVARPWGDIWVRTRPG